jgi:hypothetical protein
LAPKRTFWVPENEQTDPSDAQYAHVVVWANAGVTTADEASSAVASPAYASGSAKPVCSLICIEIFRCIKKLEISSN